MEDCKRIDAQLEHLPEAIIQHIQSKLNPQQSAATAILSKSWYNSWLTNPTLDFDERLFRRGNFATCKSVDRFLKIVNATLERYRKSNFCLQSFRLCCDEVSNINLCSLSTVELIAKALKIGANTVSLDFCPYPSEHPLPKELFVAGTLLDLSAVGCRILSAEVNCVRLKSLSLQYVYVEDGMIEEIMSRCPLIENLYLARCEGLVKVNLSKSAKLKRFTVVGWDEHIQLEIDQHCKFLKLSYLLLDGVKIDEMLFSDFSKKFPCIHDLVIRDCDEFVRFNISSRSIKNISLERRMGCEIHLDVPNIRKFKFSGSTVPTPFLITASREWELDVDLCCDKDFNASGCLELNRLLTNSHLSKISLSLHLFPRGREYSNCVPDIRDLPKPMVENLRLVVREDSVWPGLIDGVFWSLRPKIISLSIISKPRVKTTKYVLSLLSKKLKGVEISNELVEVTAEYFDNNTKQWMAKPWNTLVRALREEMGGSSLRLLLKWGHTNNV